MNAPAARQLSEGIAVLPLRTPTLPPATHTNAYLMGTRERVLVEPASPYPEEIARCVAWLEGALTDASSSLRALLLTHHHPDHVGGAVALARHFGVPIWAHAATRERLAGQVAIDRLLVDGEVLPLEAAPGPFEIEVMFTPGHAPGHLCFLDRQSGQLVAGDMVAQVGTILIAPGDGDMRQYLQSLQRMAARAPSALLPAHGEPLNDPQAVLAFYVRHRLEREARVLEALRQHAGPASARELLPVCYADKPQAVWPLAEPSVEAHLIKLEGDGHARREGRGWVAVSRAS